MDNPEIPNRETKTPGPCEDTSESLDDLRNIIHSLSLHVNKYNPDWAEVDPETIPNIRIAPPGPRSQTLHSLASQHTKGFSSQVQGFPVVFEKAHGVTMEDVDGNIYLDFSSGIVVANVGHSHPKVATAVARAASGLMNLKSHKSSPLNFRALS